MDLDKKELAKLVERLLNDAAQERKKELLKKRRESGDFIQDVHEAEIGIDPDEFEILSQTINEDGDAIIEWRSIEYVLTEFTVDEPYKFDKRGKILVRTNGDVELLS